jgi:hypothetical protein
MPKVTQEELLHIFNELKKEVKPYEKAPVVARKDIQGKYDLWTEKQGMMAMGKLRPELNFVSLIIQSSYVGFYYMPIYTNCAYVQDKLSPELLKNLKGKACFHIKKVDKDVLKHVKDAMKVGYEVYKKNGWM